MIERAQSTLRRLRRLASRSEWLRRLLKLPVSDGPPSRSGLVLIQLEGLSRGDLERALQKRKLPFLQRLIEGEGYRVHTLYSGLPAITPAVQAELFYGVESAVPGFAACDPGGGRVRCLADPAVAGEIEQRLEATRGEALLSGGSTYASCFSGGSDEAYFCPSADAAGPARRGASPLALVVLLFAHFDSLLRAAAALALGFALAIYDRARGAARGRVPRRNLKELLNRAAVCAPMRELSVIGAGLDISRGLPIVFVNFRGYGEQARNRGPGSTFALRTLRGIDAGVRRLWHAAEQSPGRHYDVWIFSDHGLIEARPCAGHPKDKVERAVAAALQGLRGDTTAIEFAVATHGSTALVCLGVAPGDELVAAAARRLAVEQGMPLVVARAGSGQLMAWTGEAEFLLPQQLAELVGGDHPFLGALAEDLARMYRCAAAGEIAIFGWHSGSVPTSFDFDAGAHGGLAAAETGAFALLPEDIPLGAPTARFARPGDLRRAALEHLGRRRPEPGRAHRRFANAPADRLRVMTYNVHGCFGMDGKLSPERIARVIARYQPDVVALQELDVGRGRSGGVDQAELIAQHLEMGFQFHPTLHVEEERYGDAILTHLPMRLVKAAALPGLEGAPGREPRGALWVSVDLDGTEIQIINTHLGLSARERLVQAEALCGKEWLAHADCLSPVILCGDLNAPPSSAACRLLRSRLQDTQTGIPDQRPRHTFASRLPVLRIDHILIDPTLRVAAVEVPRSTLVRVASDHLPLIADLLVPPRSPRH